MFYEFSMPATCPNGHDMTQTGYKVYGMWRCRLCATKKATVQAQITGGRWKDHKKNEGTK